MIIDINMPQLGESVTEGTIAKWLKKPGDFVDKYETICEVATDKVNAEIPSTIAGTMAEIIVEEGMTVEVGQLICQIKSTDNDTIQETLDHKEVNDSKEVSRKGAIKPESTTKGRYSPAVLRLSEENNIDLNKLKGTGKGGRITRSDVLHVIESGTSKTSVPSLPIKKEISTDYSIGKKDIEVPLTSVRRVISQRLVQSKAEIPHAWTMIEADVTELVKLRNDVKDSFRKREGVSLTFLPFFIKATADSIREYPYVNSLWADDKIILKKQMNISIAVATDEALFVPVIQNANEKNLLGLAKAIHTLVEKTRNNQLEIQDIQGGTFTVNNTGSFGSILSAPIINYPQAAILSFESIVKRPVVINNMIAVRDMMNLCISIDHRILDGLTAGRFLKSVKERLESYTFDTCDV